MSIVHKLKTVWVAIGKLGQSAYPDSEDKRHNALTNWVITICIFSIVISFLSNLTLFLLVYFKFLPYDLIAYPGLSHGYMPVQVVAIFLLVAFLKIKYVFKGKIFFELLLISIYLVYLMIITLFLGSGSNFQYFSLLFLTTPFSLNSSSLFKRVFTLILLLSYITLLFYLVYTREALLPLPDEVTQLIALIAKQLSVFYFIILTALGWWYLGFTAKAQLQWKKLSSLGESLYHTDEDKRTNSFTNQISFISIVLATIVTITNLVLTIANAIIDNNSWMYVFIYPGLSLMVAVSYVLNFFLRIKSSHSLRYEIIQYLIAIIYVIIVSILMGQASGYLYACLIFSAMPFYFSKASWRLRILFSLVSPVVTVLLYWLSFTVSPIYPLVPEINELLKDAIIVYIMTVTIISTIYIWRKYEYTQKFIHFWHALSNKGNEHFTSIVLKKSNVLMNQITLFFGIQSLLLITFIVVVNFTVFEKEPLRYHNYLQAYSIPALLIVAILTASYILKAKTGNFVYAYLAYFFGATIFLSLCLFLGIEGGFHYILFVFGIIPFIALPKDNKILIAFSAGFDILLVVFFFWWDSQHPPLFPFTGKLLIFTSLLIEINALLAVGILTYYLWNETYRAELKVQAEQKRVEDLLFNILPKEIAYELKEKDQAEPVAFENVSVLFTDFEGFTRVTKSMSAAEMLTELDRCFSYFDTLMIRFGVEKLKTIGESFMAAGGIPKVNKSHAIDCVLVGLEIKSFLEQMKETKLAQGTPYWEIKVGINTGPLVAGVVGNKKYAYDVWGDSVNVAARMMSSGESGKVNISQSTFEQVKQYFDCSYRGKVAAKNKGKLNMYFVNGFKPEYSSEDSNKIPNKSFIEIYNQIKA